MNGKEQKGAWPDRAEEYAAHVADTSRDSQYLRDTALKPPLIRMIGPCREKRILDVGCADGWLLDDISPAEGYGCDLYRYSGFSDRWNFSLQDVQCLSFPDSFFDVSVTSLLLIWVPDLAAALYEIHRVTRQGGTVAISLMHPYFHRTGEVISDGDVVVSRNLAHEFIIDDHRIAGEVGPLRYYYRPLSAYLTACATQRLRIEEVTESFIDIEEYQSRFGTDCAGEIRRTGKVPMYAFIRCTRD